MNERIYVIEDDANIQEVIKMSLESHGYLVETFGEAVSAIQRIEEDRPDLAIFDLMLPELDGITAIKKIREQDATLPIMILSAKDREVDKVIGLDSGCDDYMTKPFGVLELCARVRSLLRRSKRKAEMVTTPTLVINKSAHTLTQNGRLMDLTHKEYQILLYLVENKDRVVTREELIRDIWHSSNLDSRSLDVHIRSLRGKLKDDGSTYIKTIRSVGYHFIEDKHD